jgi:hypothetical protein
MQTTKRDAAYPMFPLQPARQAEGHEPLDRMKMRAGPRNPERVRRYRPLRTAAR